VLLSKYEGLVTVKVTITFTEEIGNRYPKLMIVGEPQFSTHCLEDTKNADELITSRLVAPGVVRLILNV